MKLSKSVSFDSTQLLKAIEKGIDISSICNEALRKANTTTTRTPTTPQQPEIRYTPGEYYTIDGVTKLFLKYEIDHIDQLEHARWKLTDVYQIPPQTPAQLKQIEKDFKDDKKVSF